MFASVFLATFCLIATSYFKRSLSDLTSNNNNIRIQHCIELMCRCSQNHSYPFHLNQSIAHWLPFNCHCTSKYKIYSTYHLIGCVCWLGLIYPMTFLIVIVPVVVLLMLHGRRCWSFLEVTRLAPYSLRLP